jgi:mRNA interferase YafQ
MKKLVSTPRFQRAFRKFARRNPPLQQRIENTLIQLADDAFSAKTPWAVNSNDRSGFASHTRSYCSAVNLTVLRSTER